MKNYSQLLQQLLAPKCLLILTAGFVLAIAVFVIKGFSVEVKSEDGTQVHVRTAPAPIAAPQTNATPVK